VASSVVVTIGGGSVEATEDGIISVVPVTGAAVVEAKTQNSRGVGCPVISLKVAPKLRDTGVSVTSTESDWVGVKPVTIGVKP
jgi:hypothetical protein